MKKLIIIFLALSYLSLISCPREVKSQTTINGIEHRNISFEYENIGDYKSETISNEQLVRILVSQAGYSQGEINTFLRIARAESQFRDWVTNSTTPAAGLFQIMPDTWNDNNCIGDVYNAYDNTICAIRIEKRSGFNPWVTY